MGRVRKGGPAIVTLLLPGSRVVRERRAGVHRPDFGTWLDAVFVSGAFWCKMVYSDPMSIAEKPVRQSVSLPARVARRVKSLAKTGSTSANRIIVDLIESGIEAREQERKRFFELADRLAHSRNAEDQKRLKEELARLTFGE